MNKEKEKVPKKIDIIRNIKKVLGPTATDVWCELVDQYFLGYNKAQGKNYYFVPDVEYILNKLCITEVNYYFILDKLIEHKLLEKIKEENRILWRVMFKF